MFRTPRKLIVIANRLAKSCTLSTGAAAPLIRADDLSTKLRTELDTTFVRIKDVSSCNCGQKFEAVIVSPKFEGKSLLERHRLVLSLLSEEMKSIHSFSQRNLTPSQWDPDESNS